jgi:hypothetical protein
MEEIFGGGRKKLFHHPLKIREGFFNNNEG